MNPIPRHCFRIYFHFQEVPLIDILDSGLHVLHSAAAGHRYLQHLSSTRIPPAQIILAGSAITLLVDDDVLDLHDLAGDGISVTVVTADLPALDLDVGDLPAYVYATPDLSTALRHACGGRPPTHWV